MPTYTVPFSGRPNHRLEFYAGTKSQSVANNSSVIAWSVGIRKVSGDGAADLDDLATWAAAVGANVGGSNGFGFDFRSNPYMLLDSGEVTRTHTADGTLNINVRALVGGTSRLGSADTGVIALDVPTIARASTATIDPSSTITAGDDVTVFTNRASTGFLHDITYKFGTLTGTIGTNVGGTVDWTPPLSLLTQIPSSTSGQGTITTVTKSGSTKVGTTTTAFTIKAAASVIPSVSTITATDQNTDVVSIVGKPVQSLSRVKLTVAGAGIYGSTIQSASATLLGSTVASGGEVTVTQAGTLTVSASVTDSRGRKGTGTGPLSVLAYTPPSVSAYQARRSTAAGVVADEGVYLRVDLTAAIASLINTTERNALTLRVFTRPNGGTVWTARNVITGALAYNGSFVISGGGVFDTTSSWDVRVQVQDKFATYIADTTVATIGVTLDLNGTHVGVGKIWEQGALDVAGDVYADGVKLPVPATNAETIAGTVTDKAVTPASLAALTATTGRAGLMEIATQTEANAGTDTTRAITPAILRALASLPYSTASASGSVSAPASSGVNVAVTFPSGRFSVAPNIQVTMGPTDTYLGGRAPSVWARSATGFTFAVSNTTATPTTVPFMYIAMQMTSGAANG